MRKIIQLLASFVAGAVLTFILLSEPSTSAQTPGAVPLGGFGSHPMFNVEPDAIPVIPKSGTITLKGGVPRNAIVQIDGLFCEVCTFTDAIFTYAGGAYELNGAKAEGTRVLQLEGPAANTAKLLTQFGLLHLSVPSVPAPPPPKIMIESIPTGAPAQTTLVSFNLSPQVE
jgi:hypothetical protein